MALVLNLIYKIMNFKKLKTGIATCVLMAMFIAVFSPIVQAGNRYDRGGCRKSSIYGYRSYTEGSGYDSRGNELNIGVEAYMATMTISVIGEVKYGRGSISVYSNYCNVKHDAFHRFSKNHDIETGVLWKEN